MKTAPPFAGAAALSLLFAALPVRADVNEDLLTAAARGDVAALTRAIERGAAVNARVGDPGLTALDAALELQQWGAAEHLFAHGARLEASTTGRDRALLKLLDLAPVLHPRTRTLVQVTELPGPELFRAVLAQGASTAITDEAGNNLLMLAAKRHHVTALEALLAAGLDVNARNAEGDTALCLAAGKSEYELMAIGIGLALGPDRDALLRLIFRPAQKSAESPSTARRLEAARRLLAAMADPNSANAEGNTPLLEATRSGDSELVAMLIAAGAKVDVRNALGVAPLLTAARFGLRDVAEALVDAHADVSIRDGEGHSATELARTGGHESVARLLEQARFHQ